MSADEPATEANDVENTWAADQYILKIRRATPEGSGEVGFYLKDKLVYKESIKIGEAVMPLKIEEPTGSLASYDQCVKNSICPISAASTLGPGGTRCVVLEHSDIDGKFPYEVFTLKHGVKRIANFINEGGPISLVKETNHDDCCLATTDPFSEWGARSIAPNIYLTVQHGQLHLDAKRMKADCPSLESLSASFHTYSDEFTKYAGQSDGVINSAPPELASDVIDLYYAGRAKSARRLFDSCWDKHRNGKRAYWKFLMSEIQKSKYWKDLRAMNN